MTTKKKPKATRGRPSLGRTSLVKFRATPEETERYAAAAKSMGAQLSEWVRLACDAFAVDEPARKARER